MASVRTHVILALFVILSLSITDTTTATCPSFLKKFCGESAEATIAYAPKSQTVSPAPAPSKRKYHSTPIRKLIGSWW